MKYQPKHRKKKKREFSKCIFTCVSVVTLAVIAFSCVMIWRTGDLNPLGYLIPAVSAEMATATGFYYSKAKAENQIKLQNQLKEEDEL